MLPRRLIHAGLKIPATSLVAFGAYALLVLGPVLALGISALYKGLLGQIDLLALVVPSGRSWRLLLDSLLLAGAVFLLSSTLGWLVAVLIWGLFRRQAWAIVFVAFSLAAIPPSLHAITWFQVNSIVRNAVGLDLLLGPLRGWISCLLIETSAYTPFAFACAYLGMQAIPSELVESARVRVSDLKVLTRVVLPLSTPALLAGGGIVFLLSLLDYSVPSLMQVHGFAMEIFTEYSASGSPEQAFLVSLPLLVIGIGLVAYLIGPLKSMVVQANLGNARWGNPPAWPDWFQVLTCAAGVMIILASTILLTILIVESGGSRQVLEAVRLSGGDILYTLSTALASILLSGLLAWGVARVLAGWGGGSRFAWGIVLAPLGVPAALVGAGLLFVSQAAFFRQEVLAYFAPAAANLARFTPVMVLALLAQMKRADPLLGEAALVFQASFWKRLGRVSLPLAAPAALVGAAYQFALSVGELPATLMVVPPGRATLSMRIYGYLHYGASDRVAGLCLLLVASILSAGLLAMGAQRVRSRLNTVREVGE